MCGFIGNNKKLYVVINSKYELPVIMNAIAHVTAGITLSIESPDFDQYPTTEENKIAYLSRYPIIIMTAKNSNQLKTTLSRTIEEGLDYNFFCSSMLLDSADEQIEATQLTLFEELDFIALAFYGDVDKASHIAKKFSVFKG